VSQRFVIDSGLHLLIVPWKGSRRLNGMELHHQRMTEMRHNGPYYGIKAPVESTVVGRCCSRHHETGIPVL
jgi:hypothetical protein